MKRYTELKKQTDNRYLNMYEMDAISSSGAPFKYYFATRNKDEKIRLRTGSDAPEGVLIYALKADDPSQILMLRQFRYPIGDYVYELPAGLIEEGESAGEAGAREVKEETGLDFTEYTGGDQAFRRSYVFAQGISDEMGATVYGSVSGDINKDGQEDSEDITAFFADRDEVRRILAGEKVSMRAMYLLMNFLHSDGFDFLD